MQFEIHVCIERLWSDLYYKIHSVRTVLNSIIFSIVFTFHDLISFCFLLLTLTNTSFILSDYCYIPVLQTVRSWKALKKYLIFYFSFIDWDILYELTNLKKKKEARTLLCDVFSFRGLRAIWLFMFWSLLRL